MDQMASSSTTRQVKLVSPAIPLLNSPFKVERFEKALSMSAQERLDHLGKSNYGLPRLLTPVSELGSYECKCHPTPSLHLSKDSYLFQKDSMLYNLSVSDLS